MKSKRQVQVCVFACWEWCNGLCVGKRCWADGLTSIWPAPAMAQYFLKQEKAQKDETKYSSGNPTTGKLKWWSEFYPYASCLWILSCNQAHLTFNSRFEKALAQYWGWGLTLQKGVRFIYIVLLTRRCASMQIPLHLLVCECTRTQTPKYTHTDSRPHAQVTPNSVN